VEEKNNTFLAVAKSLGTRRPSRPTRSRPPSSGPATGEKGDKEASRFSLNMSKLSLRMSKADSNSNPNSLATLFNNNGNQSSNNSPITTQPPDSELISPRTERNSPDPLPPSYVPSVRPSEEWNRENGSKENVTGSPSKKVSPVSSGNGHIGGKTKKDKESKKKHGHSHHKSGHEERDCVVM
jgi:hypothetical protein